MRHLLQLLLLLTAALNLTGAHAQAVDAVAPVRIGTWDRRSDQLTAVSEAVLQRAYAELGRPLDWVELPNRRALQALLAGEVDANLHRVQELGTAQPGLVRVAVPINASTLRLYVTAGTTRKIEGWEQLKGLRVAYPRGVVRVEQLLPAGVKRVEAGSVDEQFRLLMAGMVDVVLCAEAAGSPAITRGNKMRRLDVVLDEHALYHYLSGRHAELAQQLTTVLLRLQASGELQALRQAALQLFLQQHAGV